jgi:hypothetical protein
VYSFFSLRKVDEKFRFVTLPHYDTVFGLADDKISIPFLSPGLSAGSQSNYFQPPKHLMLDASVLTGFHLRQPA